MGYKIAKTWNYLRTTIAILGCNIPLCVLDMLSLQGVVKRALFQSGMSTSRILSLPEVDGIDEGNGNGEVGSRVNIGNGIRNGGNGYDVGETGDSGGVGMASNL
nr:hypothetical protein [Tanacetum cinerariifolium]